LILFYFFKIPFKFNKISINFSSHEGLYALSNIIAQIENHFNYHYTIKSPHLLQFQSLKTCVFEPWLRFPCETLNNFAFYITNNLHRLYIKCINKMWKKFQIFLFSFLVSSRKRQFIINWCHFSLKCSKFDWNASKVKQLTVAARLTFFV